MPNDFLDILRRYWGYEAFRGIQLDIIESIASGHDTLGLMPTGGGKSLTFQVPALAAEGVCLVVTPLISLMKDQTDRLRHLGIPAYAIHSGLSHEELVTIIDNCAFGDVKLLYLSPERLRSDDFLKKLRRIRVSFIAVDEAHCISQWGYDFRPAYLKIGELRKLLPGCPVLALTATATPQVVDDIQRQLAFRENRVFRMSFRRKNLSYVVRHTEDRVGEIVHILRHVEGSAIVYTCSRRRTRDISHELVAAGIESTFYHAGLDIAVKSRRQQDWQAGRTRVIVATNAFGMGIDKSDVRLVIHADVPTSLEAYFQEAGRAGRDGQRAYAVLIAMQSTPRMLRSRVSHTFPAKEEVRDVYEHLAYHYEIGTGMGKGYRDVFHLEEFCAKNRYSAFTVDAALRILDSAGYISYDVDDDSHTRVMFTVGRDDLYRKDIPADCDALVCAMLRTYTGMFTDYVFVDEAALAAKLGCEKQRIFVMLSELRRRGILLYVPPRTEPRITYLVDRVDGCDVKLSAAVYADRLRVMEQHVEAMIAYISDTTRCRQSQLEEYFGETGGVPCGVCDVCLGRRRATHSDKAAERASLDACMEAIATLLADGRDHRPSEVLTLGFPRDMLRTALDTMVRNGTLLTDSVRIRLAAAGGTVAGSGRC